MLPSLCTSCRLGFASDCIEEVGKSGSAVGGSQHGSVVSPHLMVPTVSLMVHNSLGLSDTGSQARSLKTNTKYPLVHFQVGEIGPYPSSFILGKALFFR